VAIIHLYTKSKVMYFVKKSKHHIHEQHKYLVFDRCEDFNTKYSNVSCGVVIQRHDTATTHEEADNIIVQQAMQVTVIEQKHVTILADDTDVYALLLHHYLQRGLQLITIGHGITY